ncbi:rhodanese-like domain-containing protein [Niveibacterium sp. SC-1]|uniref:rhodanese-like domain-containing protein n=1 Tax=Niveibacterium sp. SC-1 TaxID=3135646 RepID=UPI0031202B4D
MAGTIRDRPPWPQGHPPPGTRMQDILELFHRHGPLLVFLNVLAEQFGVPLPAVPTLLVAGALAAQGELSGSTVLILAVLGSGIANFSWYLAGKRHGVRILGLMCRISLSPDACVRRTENVFVRWGAASLLVARFVPGLSAVASPLAGAMGFSASRFILFDSLGTTLWAGAAIGAGMLLNRQVEALINALSQIGGVAILVLLGMLALYVGYRWIERQRLLRFVRRNRIGVEELHELLETGQQPIIVDVRSSATRQNDPRRIPGALEAEIEEVRQLLAEVPPEREIVFYCNCPNEASAARAARLLKDIGFRRVRSLTGGLDAWEAYVGERKVHAVINTAGELSADS